MFWTVRRGSPRIAIASSLEPRSLAVRSPSVLRMRGLRWRFAGFETSKDSEIRS
jgi:hypothetical protein